MNPEQHNQPVNTPNPNPTSQPDAQAPSAPARDNYAIAQSIYPDPTQIRSQLPAYPAEELRKAEAAIASSSLTLVMGIASPLSYWMVLYFTKNTWMMGIVSVLLAAGAIYFAVNNYRTNRELSPSTVIGLAAATITVVNVGNVIVAQLMVRSTLSSLGY